MGEVGKFIILESNLRSDPIDSFGERSIFDEMFNLTYNDIEHAFLWTDTITRYVSNKPDLSFERESLLRYATEIEPVQLEKRRDRLASFPKNLKFLAKKMALYFINNNISLEVIPKIQGFNPIITVVIIAVLHYFLIETEYEDIFDRIYYLTPKKYISLQFQVFFRLIDRFNMPRWTGLQAGHANARLYTHRRPTYQFIIKAAQQLSTMIGLSGFLNTDSSQLDQMPPEQRQELINLLQDTSKKVRIYAKIEDGPEPPPSDLVMSMFAAPDEPLVVRNAKAIERIRSKIASRRSRRGGKHKNTHRRKKTMKHSKRSRRR